MEGVEEERAAGQTEVDARALAAQRDHAEETVIRPFGPPPEVDDGPRRLVLHQHRHVEVRYRVADTPHARARPDVPGEAREEHDGGEAATDVSRMHTWGPAE